MPDNKQPLATFLAVVKDPLKYTINGSYWEIVAYLVAYNSGYDCDSRYPGILTQISHIVLGTEIYPNSKKAFEAIWKDAGNDQSATNNLAQILHSIGIGSDDD